MKKLIYSITAILLLIISAGCQQSSSGSRLALNHTRDWLGETLPGSQAQLFAEGLISTSHNERDLAPSPDGNELYFTRKTPDGFVIMGLRRTPSGWTQPEVAPFSGLYSDLEPAFSPDGSRLYFASNRPLEANGPAKRDFDIWVVSRADSGWSTPENIGMPVNTAENEFYPSINRQGELYYCSRRTGGQGGEDIWFSTWRNGQWSEPVNAGAEVNTPAEEYNACVSADGHLLLLTSTGHGPGQGGGDIWIHRRQDNGQWGPAQNLGAEVNSPYFEYCPSLSADGRLLFFTSNRTPSRPAGLRWTADLLDDWLSSTQNGGQNIYWVEISTRY